MGRGGRWDMAQEASRERGEEAVGWGQRNVKYIRRVYEYYFGKENFTIMMIMIIIEDLQERLRDACTH